MAWEMDLSGLDDFADRLHEAMPIALLRAAEHVRGVAVERTPIEEGDLRASAGTRIVDGEARIEYESVYARYQHYGLDFAHPRGGQALFLESAVVTETQKAGEIIRDTIREATL
jgi:hypothetical protein